MSETPDRLLVMNMVLVVRKALSLGADGALSLVAIPVIATVLKGITGQCVVSRCLRRR